MPAQRSLPSKIWGMFARVFPRCNVISQAIAFNVFLAFFPTLLMAVGLASSWIGTILGADVQGRFADLKQAAADRSPRELGTFVKASEVQYHHEVYNQSLWNLF